MTLTIEIKPEAMQVLADRAARLGVPVETIAARAIEREAEDTKATEQSTAPERELSPRQRAVMEGFGKYAHLNFSSDDLICDRREEAAREMAQHAKRDREQALRNFEQSTGTDMEQRAAA